MALASRKTSNINSMKKVALTTTPTTVITPSRAPQIALFVRAIKITVK